MEFSGPRGRPRQSGITGIDPLLDRLERDEFDLVAVARALVADPDWPAKALHGRLSEAIPYDAIMLDTLA
jgi:2,4-dienoyl-CoA reductase-like NADH-dependent reductase (Old Yellow Enzyme family)